MLICGSGSFAQSDQDDNEICNTTPFTTPPKRSSKRSNNSFCKIMGRDTGNKNPYADRGLDKFYALLADLDTKKQHIYTQRGSKDISFVRFTYTDDSKKVKPIVVRLKNKKNKRELVNGNTNSDKKQSGETGEHQQQPQELLIKEEGQFGNNKKKRCLRCNNSNGSFKVLEDLRKPCVYLPVVLVLILLILVVFGRSFAILCASVGWYAIPSLIGEEVLLTEEEGGLRKKRKKEYVKRVSEKKINNNIGYGEGPSSPTSVLKWGDQREFKLNCKK